MSGAVDVLIQRLTARVAAHDSSDKRGDPTWPVMIGAGDLAAVVEALTTPPARSYAEGVEDAAKLALTHSGMLALAQGHEDAEGQADRWYEGGKHAAQFLAGAIRTLPEKGVA